jgi:hypothetical protein
MKPVQAARGIQAKDQFVALLEDTRIGIEGIRLPGMIRDELGRLGPPLGDFGPQRTEQPLLLVR